uniref:Caldesmon 1 n=1 Tax=Myotis lucifugus TaxID=59463 RepID=G1QAA8_MYOLU
RIAYQRNDDDEEEAARERRRRARQERLRQKQEEESLGQVTDQVEVHAQNRTPLFLSLPQPKNTPMQGAKILFNLMYRKDEKGKSSLEYAGRQNEFSREIETMSLEKIYKQAKKGSAESVGFLTPEYFHLASTLQFGAPFKNYLNSVDPNAYSTVERRAKDPRFMKILTKNIDGVTLGSHLIKDEKIKKDKEPREEVKSFLDGKKGFTEVKSQNGEFMTHKLKHTENTFSTSRSGGRASEAKEAEGAPQVEAGKRLEELRRRRGETESEEFEKLKQKQQEAALELEELKKKREERRKVLEEEEQRRKQEEAERKVREEEEKRRLKEEIERRRAEAAEKRQKMPEDGLAEDKKPFKCFTPKGSSLKIEERAEFLNKSVQKSGVKSTHQAAVVSKIDSRLEQYTSAIEGTKAAKPTKPAASDLPVPAEGVRNIKSMWEKGNVFSSPTASGTPNKETAGLKVGVSSRINEWLTKTPDGNRSPAPKPSDLRPGDVSGKRNLWEKQSVDKVTTPAKV